MPKVVFQSYNCEIDDFFNKVQTPTNTNDLKEPSAINNFEDEDFIGAVENSKVIIKDDISEFFVAMIQRTTLAKKQVDLDVGMIVLDLDDTLIVKVMETLIVDFPASPN